MKDEIRNSIKTLTRTFYDYQKERMAIDGRLGIKKNGEVKKGAPERDPDMLIILYERRDFLYYEESKEEKQERQENGGAPRLGMEQIIAKELAKEVHKHPLWKQYLSHICGVGETIAAVIISEIDIYIAKYPSSVWCFAGMAPGKDRKKKGEKCPYNQFLKKVLLGVLGPSFLKSNSPYREYYDNMRIRLESENWGMDAKNPSDKKHPKNYHQHKAANRYMVKMFLKDLYVAWRTIEGLEVSKPYQEEYLGHKHNAA